MILFKFRKTVMLYLSKKIYCIMEFHNKNREKICLVCASSASYIVSEESRLKSLIDKYVVQDYTPLDIRLPNGLCTTCHRSLYSFDAGVFNRRLLALK